MTGRLVIGGGFQAPAFFCLLAIQLQNRIVEEGCKTDPCEIWDQQHTGSLIDPVKHNDIDDDHGPQRYDLYKCPLQLVLVKEDKAPGKI